MMMEIHERIGLEKGLLQNIIDTILSQKKKAEKIVVFGSRSGKGYKAKSDIDLALFSEQLDSKDINMLRDRLEQLPTALKFDLVAYSRISKEVLKKQIDNEGVTIYEKR
ncbi:MAG: nucleotidyltransferase domain-containing protein [Desulfobacterales bacterium]|nr:nucleotidyltransferase domain-containing protein [Desulfobacterales bacterium]